MRRASIASLAAGVLLAQLPCPIAHARDPSTDAVAAAESLYNAHRFLEAARAFEALEPEGVKYLYYAGLAYEALGHDAQAILLWNKVIAAPAVEVELRNQARERVERAQTRTTRTMITVTPALDGVGAPAELYYQGSGARAKLVLSLRQLAEGVYLESGTWEIQVPSSRKEYVRGKAHVSLDVKQAEAHVEVVLPPVEQRVVLAVRPPMVAAAGLRLSLRDEAGLEPDRLLVVHSSDVSLSLRLGRWSFRAEAAGFDASSGVIDVQPGGTTNFPILLDPASTRRELRPLAIGAGVTSLLIAAGGAVAIGLSERQLQDRCFTGMTYDAACATGELQGVGPLDTLAIGSAVAGMFAGFVITASTAAGNKARHRRRAWVAEATLGGLLMAGGGSWFGMALNQWDRMSLKPAEMDGLLYGQLTSVGVKDYRVNVVPSMIAFGLGAAMFVGSMAGISLERRLARKLGGYAGRPRLRRSIPLTIEF